MRLHVVAIFWGPVVILGVFMLNPFLAVQDSSIGDLVSHSLTHSLTDVTFDF